MPNVSRRKFLSLTAAAPVAAGALSTIATADDGELRKFAPITQEGARKRIQEEHLPNIPMITHEGKRVMFYDDLVKDKVVTLNFFFTHCDELCPLVTANLAKVQKLLGDQVGRNIHMYSFTLKPEEDNVEAIRDYQKSFGAGPGWTFLTGKPEDMEKLRRGIGFTDPNPLVDKDTTQHIGNVRYGNEPLMLWAACPGMGKPQLIVDSVLWALRPETNHVTPP